MNRERAMPIKKIPLNERCGLKEGEPLFSSTKNNVFFYKWETMKKSL